MAGVYHNLVQQGITRDQVVAFFKTIDKAGATPLTTSTAHGNMWISSPTGAFTEGESAPGSRSQEVKAAVEEITRWFDSPPKELGWR
jgi:hypothetical protein